MCKHVFKGGENMYNNYTLDMDKLPKELILIFEIIKADSDDSILL